jgi:hypothetical protein
MLLLFKATTKKTNMLKKMYIQLDEKKRIEIDSMPNLRMI